MTTPAGGTWEDSGKVGFFAADTTITTPYLRVKLSGDHTVTVAGINDEAIGVARNAAPTAGDPVAVLMLDKQGSMPFVAAGAISQNAVFYGAASGKVSATQNGAPLGKALEAASGNNSQFEGIPLALAPRFLQIADPGTGVSIPIPNCDFSVMFTIGSAGAETNALAIPKYVGQRCQLFVDTVGTGTRAVTVAAAINVGGNTIITFDAVRDFIELVGVTVAGALVWQNVNVATTALS